MTVVIKKMKSSLYLLWLMASLFVLHYGFVKLPFEYVTHIQIVWFLTSFIILMFMYGKYVVGSTLKIKYLNYVLLLMIFPFFYGVVGSINLNQTIVEGIVAGRIFFWLFVLIVMVMLIRHNQISENKIIASLKIVSWLCLFAYIGIILFADLTKSKTYDNTLLRGERLRFDATFIVYGFMYYYLLALTSKKYLTNYVLCIPFMAFLAIYLQSRAVLSALILAAVIVPMLCFERASKIKFLSVAIFAAICVIIYIQVQPGNTLELLFKYLLELIIEGDTEDMSASYRNYEAEIALESIADHPWFGIGLINYQSNMIKEIFGRVNVADVGILGIIMEYGYIGALILMAQFIPAWKMLLSHQPQRSINMDYRKVMLLLLMNVYMFFMCLFTGMLAYGPLSVMLFTCLLITRPSLNSSLEGR